MTQINEWKMLALKALHVTQARLLYGECEDETLQSLTQILGEWLGIPIGYNEINAQGITRPNIVWDTYLTHAYDKWLVLPITDFCTLHDALLEKISLDDFFRRLKLDSKRLIKVINTVKKDFSKLTDLLCMAEGRLLSYRNIGPATLSELKAFLQCFNLKLDTDPAMIDVLVRLAETIMKDRGIIVP